MHSIRVKITAITIAAVLTSILSVLFACFFTIRSENDHSNAEKMVLLSQNVQMNLDGYLDGIEQSVEMVANMASDSLDGVYLVEMGADGTVEQTPEKEQELARYLREHCSNLQKAFGSLAGHAHGVVSYYYCINPSVSEMEHGFFYAKIGKTGYGERRPLDARELNPNDPEHSAWYYTPIQRGRPSWVGPYRDEFQNERWTLSYLAPIYKAGTLIGVMGMDIPLNTLVEQVRPIKLYDSGFACLFDSDGKVVYHPDRNIGTLIDDIDLAAAASILRQENSGDELIRYSVNGEARRMSFSTLSTGMKLVVTAPEREIVASWTRLTRIILLSTAAILAFFVVITLLVVRYLTSPLQRLTAASRRLAARDYDVELDYDGKDEVGMLTNAFSQMRDHMRVYINDLNRRVLTDEMTGLPNMNYFFQLAEDRRAELLAKGRHPAMLHFNLIGLKYYNRQYGFAEGDKLICALAEILRKEFGEQSVSRFGQDHFAVVAQEEGLEFRLARVFEQCEQANGGKTLPVRVGIYPNRLGRVKVNVACDRAKYAGDQHRGIYLSKFYYFDQSMLERIENIRYVINNLDRAIAERWIKVYFQPIVRAANGRVCDEEALSRWFDPIKGALSPGEFIPILEDARLIYKLDLYVLDQILLKMQHQKEEGLYVVPQSLNLSRVDFEVCDIIHEICVRVDQAGIARDKLTIEVTESAVGSDFEFIKEQIRRFQELGFQVLMDDFGSGYSSLDVLQDIRFDLIKFDMRFMHRFGEGDESKIILTELIKMAIALGVETVAEGVETQEQVEFLREVGCTKLQGFYYSPAIPLEKIVERNREGIQIGFENPDEAGYYSVIGRINLHDLASVSSGAEEIGTFFDALPMAVVESDERGIQIIRCNKSYREFTDRYFTDLSIDETIPFSHFAEGKGAPFGNAIAHCRKEGQRAFIDEKLPNGAVIHAMARYIAENPVTGIVACVVVVLGITAQ